jgi:hypothetical protein
MRRIKAKWISHIMLRYCLLKMFLKKEGRKEGRIEMARRGE